jgi:flagellin-like protein
MKGVSPLIATVLLVAFTVVIATLVSSWFSELTHTTTDSISDKNSITSGCSGASVTIDQVYASSTSARAALRNSGNLNLSIVSAQFFNSTGNNFTTSTTLPASLARGGVLSLEFGINMSSCPAGFSDVIVTTSCGAAGAEFDAVPKCL